MKHLLALTIFLTLSVHGNSQDKVPSDYGIEISFTVDTKIFPPSWRTEEIAGKAINAHCR